MPRFDTNVDYSSNVVRSIAATASIVNVSVTFSTLQSAALSP